MTEIPGGRIQYEGGRVLYSGEELDSRHFLESLKPHEGMEAAVDGYIWEVVLEIRRALYQELVDGWPSNGIFGFEAEFGKDVFQDLLSALKHKNKTKIAFFGSGYGQALNDVFSSCYGEKAEIHEFCLTQDVLRRNENLQTFVDSGRLVVHTGPFEFIPLDVNNLDFIFSRLGPFYHGHHHLIPEKIRKAVRALRVGGEAFIDTQMTESFVLVKFLGSGFEVTDITSEKQSEQSNSRKFHIKRLK